MMSHSSYLTAVGRHETDAERSARSRREFMETRAKMRAHDEAMAAGTVYAVSDKPVYALFGVWEVIMTDGFHQQFNEDRDEQNDEAFRTAERFIAEHQAPAEYQHAEAAE